MLNLGILNFCTTVIIIIIIGIEAEHADYILREVKCTDELAKSKEFHTLYCYYIGTAYHFVGTEKLPEL